MSFGVGDGGGECSLLLQSIGLPELSEPLLRVLYMLANCQGAAVLSARVNVSGHRLQPIYGSIPNCNLRIGKWGQGSHPEFRLGREDGEGKRESTFLTLTSAECCFLEVQKMPSNNRHPNSDTIMQIQPPLHPARLSGWDALCPIHHHYLRWLAPLFPGSNAYEVCFCPSMALKRQTNQL